jgi:hypothetical protein
MAKSPIASYIPWIATILSKILYSNETIENSVYSEDQCVCDNYRYLVYVAFPKKTANLCDVRNMKRTSASQRNATKTFTQT